MVVGHLFLSFIMLVLSWKTRPANRDDFSGWCSELHEISFTHSCDPWAMMTQVWLQLELLTRESIDVTWLRLSPDISVHNNLESATMNGGGRHLFYELKQPWDHWISRKSGACTPFEKYLKMFLVFKFTLTNHGQECTHADVFPRQHISREKSW